MKKNMLITFVNNSNSAILDYDNFPKMIITGDYITDIFSNKWLVVRTSIDLLNNKLFIYVSKQ